MAGLQYVDVPGYAAVIIRDTFANLSKPDGLIMRSQEWLANTKAAWNGDLKKWTFPGGASLSFSYLDGPMDHFNHQSAAYQYVGIDEAVQIRENQALYMFSRMRRLESMSSVPIRFRVASNPPMREQLARGKWVKERYINPLTKHQDAVFIPAALADNPYLDQDEYIKTLNLLDPISRQQLLYGDWNINAQGELFQRQWFKLGTEYPDRQKPGWIRFWDLAATKKTQKNKDPDWTAGGLLRFKDGVLYVGDIIRKRGTPLEIEKLIQQTAQLDGKHTKIYITEEPGAAGKFTIDHFIRRVLPGYAVYPFPEKKSKEVYGSILSSKAEAGNVVLIEGSWNRDFLDEAELFPNGPHDDQVDVVAKGGSVLFGTAQGPIKYESIAKSRFNNTKKGTF